MAHLQIEVERFGYKWDSNTSKMLFTGIAGLVGERVPKRQIVKRMKEATSAILDDFLPVLVKKIKKDILDMEMERTSEVIDDLRREVK